MEIVERVILCVMRLMLGSMLLTYASMAWGLAWNLSQKEEKKKALVFRIIAILSGIAFVLYDVIWFRFWGVF